MSSNFETYFAFIFSNNEKLHNSIVVTIYSMLDSKNSMTIAHDASVKCLSLNCCHEAVVETWSALIGDTSEL